MTKHNNILTLDDIPDIISDGLLIVKDELARIAAIHVNKRTPADIKITLSCITALTAADKARQTEDKQLRVSVNMLNTEQIKQIAADSQPRVQAAAVLAEKMHSARTQPTDIPLPLERQHE